MVYLSPTVKLSDHKVDDVNSNSLSNDYILNTSHESKVEVSFWRSKQNKFGLLLLLLIKMKIEYLLYIKSLLI